MSPQVSYALRTAAISGLTAAIQSYLGAGGPALAAGGVMFLPLVVLVLEALRTPPPPTTKGDPK